MNDKTDYPNLKDGVKFSSENQPSSEAKSKGMKKSWEYRKARQQFFEKLTDIEMKDGSIVDFWEQCKGKLQEALFDSNSKVLSGKDKLKLIMTLISELMPEEKKVNVDITTPIDIHISEKDSKL